MVEMGHLFRQAGEYDQADSWYRKAIDADPAHASCHIYLGDVLAKQGRLRERPTCTAPPQDACTAVLTNRT
jgi:hypothetical protein